MSQPIDPMTYKEIADLFGVSATTIQIIEKRALEKLRKVTSRLGLTPRELLGSISNHNQTNHIAITHGERE